MNDINVNVNALLIRAFKTFVQAFLAIIIAGLTPQINVATGKALLISAIAAGLSAVMNLFLAPQEAK